MLGRGSKCRAIGAKAQTAERSGASSERDGDRRWAASSTGAGTLAGGVTVTKGAGASSAAAGRARATSVARAMTRRIPDPQIGSQLNTSPERSSFEKAWDSEGRAYSAIASGVQPASRCTDLIGRIWL